MTRMMWFFIEDNNVDNNHTFTRNLEAGSTDMSYYHLNPTDDWEGFWWAIAIVGNTHVK
jgi:hypothetical protein